MKIKKPLFISSRLMAAIKIGNNSTIHIEPVANDGEKIEWKFIVDEGDKKIGEGESLRTHSSEPRDAIKTLLSFLSAAAEAYKYEMSGKESENSDLFSPEINEWAYLNDSEIEMASFELEEGEEN